jgi:6-phosphogluconolactonase
MQSHATPDSAIAYVSNADSGDISVLRLDRRMGTLELIQTLEVGGNVMPLALSPDQRLLYAALRSEPYRVATLSRDARTGELTRIGTAPLPDSMAYIGVDRTGRWLFGASYGGSQLSVSPIAPDGLPGAATTVMPTGKNAHALAIDSRNAHLLVTNLGSDQVLQLRFDAADGRLTPNDPPAFMTRPGAGPRHLVFHPSGRKVYLLHELDGTLDVLDYDPGRGTLSLAGTLATLPDGFGGKAWAADIHLTPDGRFLYTSERNSSTLAMWRLNDAGEPALVGHQPTETQPRGFQIDPSGSWLLAVGQASHRLTAYRIDAVTGKLAPQLSLAVGKNPNWVEIVDLPAP